jgi:competence protein ComEC
MPRSSEEFRCTFLAVGHGLCTVLETPDGQTFLYDVGAMTGPEVTRRQIAPFLWHRGIRKVDEVFLSHPDWDHFNGLSELLKRFAVGQVTYTEFFPKKWEVQGLLVELDRRHILRREVKAGDRLHAGSVDLEVLHPPVHWDEGPENATSLVLLVRHGGHTLLLTGDLESPGLERLLSLPPPNIDILLAPHHGSRAANTPALAAWARPKVVVSSQGIPRSPAGVQEPYTRTGARYLATWPAGAVAVHSSPKELVVETFRSRERYVVPKRSAPAAILLPSSLTGQRSPHVPDWPALAATPPGPAPCPRQSGLPGRATNRKIPGCAKCRPDQAPTFRTGPHAG